MSKYLFVFGRQRLLSMAELYGRYPQAQWGAVGPDWAVLNLSSEFKQADLNGLGGSIKAARVSQEVEPSQALEALAGLVAPYAEDRKFEYAVSVYGLPERELKILLPKLKRKLQALGLKTRFINNQFQNLTAAQYKSLRGKGREFLVARQGGRLWVGETVAMQDIDAYSQRDYGKPFRDMRMGMLPPKLAQALLNLTGVSGTVWDPFCGSGTLVMEGVLAGRPMLGSDVDPRRVEGANQNVEWLQKTFAIRGAATICVQDATQPFSYSFDAIATEADLGMPHSQNIRPDLLRKVMDGLDRLYTAFFQNLKTMGFRGPVVIALPFFRQADGSIVSMSSTVEAVERLGFRRSPLLPEIARGEDRFQLLYSRPDQAVGRAIHRFKLS